MYSRSYYQADHSMRIPDGYDGTALLEPPMSEITPKEIVQEPVKREVKVSPRDAEEENSCEAQDAQTAECNAHAEKWQMPPFLKNIFPSDMRFSSLISGIGSEEILIAAIALFLFFSHGGDKLCAGILLFLIFIK